MQAEERLGQSRKSKKQKDRAPNRSERGRENDGTLLIQRA
jgi:hypothetical protein